eukprot:759430-Hanusia_phi.AAC.1
MGSIPNRTRNDGRVSRLAGSDGTVATVPRCHTETRRSGDSPSLSQPGCVEPLPDTGDSRRSTGRLPKFAGNLSSSASGPAIAGTPESDPGPEDLKDLIQ